MVRVERSRGVTRLGRLHSLRRLVPLNVFGIVIYLVPLTFDLSAYASPASPELSVRLIGTSSIVRCAGGGGLCDGDPGVPCGGPDWGRAGG
jgi:hypothetical protein